MKKLKGPSESQIQSSFFQWLSLYPNVRKFCFAIPNGGSRHPVEAVNLKRQGVTKGVPDVFVAIPNKSHHGLFIEFKAGKNNLTDSQKEMMDILIEVGYEFGICYSIEEAIKVIKDYLSHSDCFTITSARQTLIN